PSREEPVKVLTPRQIYDHLDRYVIGQTAAKRAVATAAHQHLKRIEQRRIGKATLLRKSNLLLMGPTGSGKTHIARKLADLLEVREIFVPLNVTQHWNKHDFVQIDTADILFICAGTFTDLHQVQVDKTVGFGSAGRRMGSSRLRVKELIEYGMLAELLGRLPVQVQLTELTSDELYQVLTAPPDSLVKEYREALSLDGVELELREPALRAMVRYAVEKRLGARGLRGILEEVLADVLFEAPERRGDRVVVDRAYVESRLVRLDGAALKE